MITVSTCRGDASGSEADMFRLYPTVDRQGSTATFHHRDARAFDHRGHLGTPHVGADRGSGETVVGSAHAAVG
jgi:hypothetical protein